ncbi:MAG: hypothetical protein ACE1Y4_06090 [Lysobacterales bacterium]
MSQSPAPELTERQQYWLNHIRACDRSGQTIIDYAREHGINVKSLYSARKSLVQKGKLPRPQPDRFQKVQVVSSASNLANQWQVQFPNGTAISFTGPVDAAALSLVLNTVASLR